MGRLTFDGNFCDIVQCLELPCPYNNCTQRQVWERLKQYEDTARGLIRSSVKPITEARQAIKKLEEKEQEYENH